MHTIGERRPPHTGSCAACRSVPAVGPTAQAAQRCGAPDDAPGACGRSYAPWMINSQFHL
eukprot:scaffold6471_cov31-Phaeocystis_antarctica.AAC.1